MPRKAVRESLCSKGFSVFKSRQAYYVDGPSWWGLRYADKRKLLSQIKAANTIPGRTPYVTFRDDRSGRILAEFGEVKFEAYE